MNLNTVSRTVRRAAARTLHHGGRRWAAWLSPLETLAMHRAGVKLEPLAVKSASDRKERGDTERCQTFMTLTRGQRDSLIAGVSPYAAQ